MIESFNGRHSLRSALLLGAASAAALSVGTPAFAQDDQNVETVVVTGSRIPQQGLYSSSPVTAVGQQEMKFEGTTNVENLISSLPSSFADQGSAVANGATGTATANLRNLGANRTLVLVDGKRLMPGDPNTAGTSTAAPDLNLIPAALVDHVEVLTGGASSVYGSDAVAGVVNFIMRKDFEGIELDGQYSVAQHGNGGNSLANDALNNAGFPLTRPPGSTWDGGDTDATLILGTNTADGKGNVTAYVGYRNIQKVLEGARDWSACAMAANSNPVYGFPSSLPQKGFTCLGSSNSATGHLTVHDITQPGPDGIVGTADDVTLTNPNSGVAYRTNANGLLTPYVGSRDAFNYAPLNYLQRPDERYTGGAFAHYEISKALDVFANFMFMDDHTVAQIAPSGYFRGTAPFNGNMHVNCDNPFLGSPTDPNSPFSKFCAPFIAQGLPITGDVPIEIGRRFVEAGDRQDDLRHTDYRMVVGLKGDLGDNWNYEVFGQYGTVVYSENYLNDASVSHEQNALEVVDVGGVPTCKAAIAGSDAACVPYNIFNLNGLTPEVRNYIALPGFKEGSTVEQVVGANIAGDLGQWGGQSPWAQTPIGVSLGAEYRQEKLTLRTDAEFQTGDLAGQGGPTTPVDGGYNVSEVYGEIRVPIVQGMPFAEDLTANAGYRYSSYNLSGTVSSYKYGLEWQPIDDFRLRAGYARAVRAPNVLELFSQQSIGLWGGADPCGSAAATNGLTAAECANTGLSPALYGSSSLDCPAGQCSALFGGNTNLKPETADSWTAGIVFTPTFIDGLTATIDYFNIKVKGIIKTLPQQTVISGCALSGAPFLCDLIHRAPGSGIIFGTTAGYVETLNTNTGFLQNEGVDVEINYQTDLDQLGMGANGALAINLLGTYTGSYESEPLPPAIYALAGLANQDIPAVYQCAGRFGNVCGIPTPKWRHKLRVTWSSPWDFDVSVAWRFIGGSSVDFNTDNPLLNGLCGHACGDQSDAHISAYNYFDIAGTWTVREGVELRGGITNLFDKDPPILDSSYVAAPPFGNGNTFPQVYDSLGRVFFVGATLKY